jgi:hypothetical protein
MSQICYILGEQPIRMAQIGHPERYSWWLNELESLGVNTKCNELNDLSVASSLTENLKQLFFEEYQRTFNEK